MVRAVTTNFSLLARHRTRSERLSLKAPSWSKSLAQMTKIIGAGGAGSEM
jgi:hypothetical protein